MTNNILPRLSITHVEADRKARLNAQVWQALAGAERRYGEDSVAVVRVTDDSDTIVCVSWRAWRSITDYIYLLEREVTKLKGETV